MDGIVVLVTAPSKKAAERVSQVLLDKRLAACVNTMGPVSSSFLWKGAIENASEYLLIIKTCRERFAELTTTVRAIHDYDVPEIIGLPIIVGEPAYLSWIDAEVSRDA